jgi:hypothetical protein
MALERYLTYTESDAAGKLTVAANDLTVTGLDNDDGSYLYKDFTSGNFSEDFAHSVQLNISSVTGIPFLAIWGMMNSIGDLGSQVASPTAIALVAYTEGSHLIIAECQSGAVYQSSISINEDTDYYITISRDEGVGAYGTLYLHVYTDPQFMHLLSSTSVTLHSKTDFQYLYGMSGQTGGAGGAAITAVISDLLLVAYPYCLGQLRLRVRDIVNEDTAINWSNDELNRYINDAEREIAIRSSCLQHIDSLSTSAVAGSLGFEGSYILDEGGVSDTYLRSLTFDGYRTAYLEYIDSTIGRGMTNIASPFLGRTPIPDNEPANWFSYRDNIYIEPTPTTTYSINAYISDYPSSEMSGYGDIPQIPPSFRPLIIPCVVSRCLAKDERMVHSQMMYSIFVNELMYQKWGTIDIVPDLKAMTNYHEFHRVT